MQLTEEYRFPPPNDKRLAADKLNLEFCRRICIGGTLKEAVGIPQLVRRRERRTADVGEGLVAAYRDIGVNISQIDLVTKLSLKIDDVILARPSGAVACR